MQYEELQAIWETQRQRPVFAVNDFGLHMELFRTRKRARRKLFWEVVTISVVSPVLLFFLAVPAIMFFVQVPVEQFPPDELPMTVWDVLACLVGVGLIVFAAWSMYVSRWKHEKHQKVFAPSLRQEIELGIAQLDFEMSMITSGRAWRVAAAFNLGALILCWEMGRINDHPLPWDVLWMVAPAIVGTFAAIVPANRKAMEKGLQRKFALEALSAKLNE